ncbi:MAG: ABC transporter ATP-binding protein, partial [Pseudomonadota bacterium]
VVPFLTLVADPGVIENHASVRWLQSFFGEMGHGGLLVLLGCGFVGVVFLSNALNLLGLLAAEQFTFLVTSALQHALFVEYLRSDCTFHLKNDAATLAANVLQEVQRLTGGIIQNGLLCVSNLIAAVLIFVAVVVVNPAIAAAAVLVLGATYLLMFGLMRRRLARNGRVITDAWHERARLVGESFGAIKEILLLRNQRFFSERFRLQSQLLGRAQASTSSIAQAPRYIIECVTAAGLVGAVLYFSRGPGSAAWMIHISFLGMATYRLLPALQQTFASAARVRANRAGFDKIAGDLRRAHAAVAEPVALPLEDAWLGRPGREIRLRDVTFRFPVGRSPAVRELNLQIVAGTFVALVGQNGAGKTTVADLLLGLLRPQTGTVEVDGTILDQANLASWQATTAYVPQSSFLINASLAENIALGVERDAIDPERLRYSIASAQLDALVATLPRGIDEPIGERGARLSGGQRQRVGIARAMYRRRSLLVLDEVTSALDGHTEREFIAMLEELRGSHTIVLIAHRLSSVRGCDRIFELEHGSVINSGTYAELCAKSARFRQLNEFAA